MFPSLAPSLVSLLHGLERPPSSSSSSSASSSSSPLFSRTELEEIEHIVEELKGVQKTWQSIEAVLADAEERQIRDKSVRLWLRDLKDLAEQIQDLRDVYEYDVVAMQVQSSMATSSEVRPSATIASLLPLADASYRDKIAADVGRIKRDFDSIAERRKVLRLEDSDGHKYSPRDGTMIRVPTGQLVEEPAVNFLGRDRDLERVRDLLVADRRGGSTNVEVIVVKGMGGVGKTTLAQHVCKDPRVVENFDEIGWVHVSEKFDLVRLTKAVVETFSDTGSSLSEFSSLQKEVSRSLKDKKVLLVMDDVWRIERGWESLMAPFHSEPRKGSKILVTTRLPEVANGVGAVDPLELGRLSQEDGWSLLRKHALLNQSSDVDNLEELEGIGKRIVEKCGGLPLSIKLLGGLLRGKENDEGEWRDVMESNLLDFSEGSEVGEQILGSLYLSYLYLSPQLKSCFKFCATFPKEDIKTKRLKRSWVLYDLVYDEKEASKCLHELQSRYFLEYEEYGRVHMHDHVYDLAKYVLGEEIAKLEYVEVFPAQLDETHFSGAQHASITYIQPTTDIPPAVDYVHWRINAALTNLRTLEFNIYNHGSGEVHLSPGRCLRELRIQSELGAINSMSCDGCQDQLKCVRVFVLSLNKRTVSLPAWVSQLYNLRHLHLRGFSDMSLDCVYNLRNLRYLIVENSMIRDLPQEIPRLTNMQELRLRYCDRISSLSESISELVNLQVLDLARCRDLKELPYGIIKLTNLRVLNIWGTAISWMPRGIKALTRLEDLTYHVNSVHAGLAELEKMRYLQDVRIKILSYRVTEEDAAQAQIATKNRIRELHLEWAHDERLGTSRMAPEKIILAMFLHWRKYALEHSDLLQLEYLPDPSYYSVLNDEPAYLLGLMLSKQAMFLLGKEQERVAHREKRVFERLRPHPTVEEITISGYRGSTLPSWMGDESFTKLVELGLWELRCCTSLSPIDQLPSLEDLWLSEMDSLKEVFPYQSNIGHDIGIMHPPTERRPQFFPKLKYLSIFSCESLRFLPLHKFSSLKYVDIHSCSSLLRSTKPPYGRIYQRL